MSELYELPDGWKYIKLRDIVSEEKTAIKRGPFGSALKKAFFVKSGYKIYEQKNAIKNDFFIGDYYIDDKKFEELKGFEVKSGDIIISCSGTIGKIAVAPISIQKGIINQALLKLTLNNEIIDTTYFVNYWKDYVNKGMSEGSSKGAAIKNLASVKILKDLLIPLPPIHEQKRIVAKLDALFERMDSAISLHQKNIDDADKFMGTVLNEVFGELEEKYGLIQIHNIVQKTKNLKPLNEKEKYFTYIDISSINNKSFAIKSPKKLLGKEAPSRAKKEIIIGDIVYATTRPNLKNIAIVEQAYDNPIASTGFCILRVNDNAINNYLFYYLLTNNLYEQIEPNIRGAQYPAISDKDLTNCNIPLPPIQTQQKTVTYLDQISQKVEKLKEVQKEKLQNLKDLKASLLDKAFRGEL